VITPSQPVQTAELLGPLHTPHTSNCLTPYGSPQQSAQALLPSQTPHLSSFALPFGTPKQSTHELLSPPQTPHASTSLRPNNRGTLSQPTHPNPPVSVRGTHVPQASRMDPCRQVGSSGQILRCARGGSQTPHRSNSLPLNGTPSQPAQDFPEPPQTPHASLILGLNPVRAVT
jgi:hypothetical protein